MCTSQAWSFHALADADAIGRRHLPLEHTLCPMLVENDRWRLDDVHTQILMYSCFGRCFLTFANVVCHMRTCYIIDCRPWPILFAVGRYVPSTTYVLWVRSFDDVAWCWWTSLSICAGPMCARHARYRLSFTDAHVWCPHATSYVWPTWSSWFVAPILT